jgi:hypothetical protein
MPGASCDDLGRDRAFDDGADRREDIPIRSLLLGQEARVRGDAVDETEGGSFADLRNTRRIEEDLHGSPSFLRTPDYSISSELRFVSTTSLFLLSFTAGASSRAVT